jgi:hypothetical protein
MLEAKKKDSSWGILELLEIDITKIKEEVLAFDIEWKVDTSRQETFATHRHTEMYPLRFMDYDWQPGNPIHVKDINSLKADASISQMQTIFNTLENLYDGKAVRVELVRMLPNTNIRRHVDGGPMLAVTRRCHLPIITNEKVFFTVYQDTVNMKEGKAYEINNSMPHSVQNASNEMRVHLIIDILPNKYFL